MKELLHKRVHIVFDESKSNCGYLGINCEVLGIEDGFILVKNFRDEKETYYGTKSIASISILDESK